MSEHNDQVALFEWAQLNKRRPGLESLETLYAVPNGAKLVQRKTHSRRFVDQAVILKLEGMKVGQPDTCLPVTRRHANGAVSSLHIELKVGKNLPTPEQIARQRVLNRHGAVCLTIWGWPLAAHALEAYLLEQPDFMRFLTDSFAVGPRGGRSYRWQYFGASAQQENAGGSL
jgi:hypothetical protein